MFENKIKSICIMNVVENVQRKDIFYIILLKDGLVTVPKQWLTDDKKYTFWPSNVNAAQRINLIKCCAKVNIQWEKYEIEFIFGSAETYKRARKKEKLAEKVSDINTTSDEGENKRKRKLRSKKICTSSESEDDASVVAKLPRKNKPLPVQLTYPKPPSLKAPSVFSVMRNMDPSVSSVMRNMDHIEKSNSDYDIEIEEEIDKNQNSNNSGLLKNTSDNSCENVAHNTKDKNFKTFVITRLVDITNRVERCEFLLKKKQNNYSEQLENQIHDTENNILDEKFPMKSLDDVRDIEQQLKHDETFIKQVKSALYCCSQITMKKSITRFMKILFTDEVATKFSWTGQKENKQKFETLFLWKIIFGVIRSKFKDVNEGDVSASLKIWLAHAQDRIKNKRQE